MEIRILFRDRKIPMFFIILIITSSVFLSAEQRLKRKDLKELSDPKSESYVPFPYPENRREIIEDLIYYANTFCGESSAYEYSGVEGKKRPINDQVLLDLFSSKSPYKIGRIIKVRNYISAYPDQYCWLILIVEKKGSIIMRAAMEESGLMIGNGVIDENALRKAAGKKKQKMERARGFKEAEEVILLFSKKMKRNLIKKNFKNMSLVTFPSHKAHLPYPIWEFEFDGITYYYVELEDIFYHVERKLPWRKNIERNFRSPLEMVGHRNFLIDTLNDQILVLQAITGDNGQ